MPPNPGKICVQFWAPMKELSSWYGNTLGLILVSSIPASPVFAKLLQTDLVLLAGMNQKHHSYRVGSPRTKLTYRDTASSFQKAMGRVAAKFITICFLLVGPISDFLHCYTVTILYSREFRSFALPYFSVKSWWKKSLVC